MFQSGQFHVHRKSPPRTVKGKITSREFVVIIFKANSLFSIEGVDYVVDPVKSKDSAQKCS